MITEFLFKQKKSTTTSKEHLWTVIECTRIYFHTKEFIVFILIAIFIYFKVTFVYIMWYGFICKRNNRCDRFISSSKYALGICVVRWKHSNLNEFIRRVFLIFFFLGETSFKLPEQNCAFAKTITQFITIFWVLKLNFCVWFLMTRTRRIVQCTHIIL